MGSAMNIIYALLLLIIILIEKNYNTACLIPTDVIRNVIFLRKFLNQIGTTSFLLFYHRTKAE